MTTTQHARVRILVRRVCSALVAMTCLCVAFAAAASDFESEVEAAVAAYQDGEYDKAITHFEAAYAEDQAPELLYNMGRAAEAKADFVAAVDYYTRFVASPGVEHEARVDALERIEALRTVAQLGGSGTLPSTGAGQTGGGIDLNTASASQLETLPGIGPKRAQAILDDRDANGPFASVDDVTRVNGVGRGTVDNIRAMVRVGPGGVTGAPSSGDGDAPVGGGGPQVNINSASAGQLESLPGIGPKKAQAIIEERDANGPYASCADLTRVNGIGRATARKVAAQCTIE